MCCTRMLVDWHRIDRLQEIQTWGLRHEADIVILTETRWSYTNEWTHPKWNMIHSGSSDRSDGILIMVRQHVCPTELIGIAEYIPGRLIHLRFPFKSRSFDLICGYQFVDDRRVQTRSNRQTCWNTLDQCLGTIPNRNALLLAGDFNCAVSQDRHHVGTAHFTWRNHQMTGYLHKDSAKLHDLLHRYDFTILNSWNAKDPPTYHNNFSASRIDFSNHETCGQRWLFETNSVFSRCRLSANHWSCAYSLDVYCKENSHFLHQDTESLKLQLSTAYALQTVLEDTATELV